MTWGRKRSPLVRGTGSNFLHHYRDAGRRGLHDLHHGIGDVNVGRKDASSASAGGVERIGGGSGNFLDVVPRTGDGHPGWIDVDLGDLLAFREVAHDSGANFNVAG